MARAGNHGGGSPAKPDNDRMVVMLREPVGWEPPMSFTQIGRRMGFTRQRAAYVYYRAKRAAQ